MRFEWHITKSRANLAKHGVDFADAVAVFEDELALSRPDTESSRGEQRFVALGMDAFARLLVVVFTEHDDCVRIISARVATRQERKVYEG